LASQGLKHGTLRLRRYLALLAAGVALVVWVWGCGRGRPARPASPPAPQPLEVRLVWHLGLSPSGEWLTFESMLQRGPEVIWAVSWLMPTTGGPAQPLAPVTMGSAFPVWSPNAEEVAYIQMAETTSLHVRRAEEALPRLTVEFGGLWLAQLCWSPDGKTLACLATDYPARRRDPVLIDAATGKKRTARLRVPATVSPLVFVDGGQGLVFAREGSPVEPGQEPRLFLMKASTSTTEMTEYAQVDASLCQAAVPVDGKLLLQLLHHRTGTGAGPHGTHEKQLVLIDPAGGPPQPLGKGSLASAQSLRRREGRWEMVFERGGDLFIGPLKPTGEEDLLRLTETPETETGAVFSPDGKTVYFVRSPSPAAPPTLVVRRDLTDGRETVLAAVTPEMVERTPAP